MGEMLQVFSALIFMGLGFLMTIFGVIGGAQYVRADLNNYDKGLGIIVGFVIATIGAGLIYFAGVLMP